MTITHDWEQIWQHFDRMQQRIMATKTTRDEFFEQPEDERMDFYNWLKNQAGDYPAGYERQTMETTKKTTRKKRVALFECLECGKKYYTVKTAEKASYDGCKKCGGVDIDVARD